MSVSIQIDASQFQKAVKEYIANSDKELSAELNRRMFYVLLRVMVLIPPMSISAAKQKAKNYLEAFVSLGVAKRGESGKKPASKMLRRIHLIAQGRLKRAGKKPLLPFEIKQQSATPKSDLRKSLGSIRRAAISGQGYVKSAVVKALDRLSRANLGRAFSQYGRAAVVRKSGKVSRPEAQPNAALLKIAAEYGANNPLGQSSNVGIFRGTKANVTPAKPGFSPQAVAEMLGYVRTGEEAKVNGILASAFQRALNDEAAQLVAKMAEKAQAVADKYNGR